MHGVASILTGATANLETDSLLRFLGFRLCRLTCLTLPKVSRFYHTVISFKHMKHAMALIPACYALCAQVKLTAKIYAS